MNDDKNSGDGPADLSLLYLFRINIAYNRRFGCRFVSQMGVSEQNDLFKGSITCPGGVSIVKSSRFPRISFPAVLAACFFLAVMAGCSRSSKPGVAKLEAGSLTVDKGGYHMVFRKGDAFSDETHMIFGIQVNGDDEDHDAYLAVIPMETVKSLKKQYADIDSCKGDGAYTARSYVQNVLLFGLSAEVMEAARHAYDSDLSAQRTGGDRICVRLQGHWLDYVDGTYQGMQLSFGVGREHMIYPESLTVASCN
ncbi:MAG: hypothetical protein LBT71_02110 [Azoarcus sp.]|jgi:hypothetical protein|nr:hypothetical protein [Azoarcus sp.]